MSSFLTGKEATILSVLAISANMSTENRERMEKELSGAALDVARALKDDPDPDISPSARATAHGLKMWASHFDQIKKITEEKEPKMKEDANTKLEELKKLLEQWEGKNSDFGKRMKKILEPTQIQITEDRYKYDLLSVAGDLNSISKGTLESYNLDEIQDMMCWLEMRVENWQTNYDNADICIKLLCQQVLHKIQEKMMIWTRDGMEKNEKSF